MTSNIHDTRSDTGAKAKSTPVDVETMSAFPVSQYNGRWCFRSDFHDASGRRRQVRRSFATEREAVQAYLAFEKAKESSSNLAAAGMTVRELYHWWLGLCRDQSLKVTTLEHYEDLYDRYVAIQIGHIQAARLTPDHLRDLVYRPMVSSGFATNTIQNVRRRLNSAFSAAVLEGKLDRNIVQMVKTPKGVSPKTHVVLTPDQVRQLLSIMAKDRLFALWMLVLSTGMRRGELVGLKWTSINFNTSEVVIDSQRTVAAKSGVVEHGVKTAAGERTLTLPPLVFDALRDWKTAQTVERMMLRGLWAGDEYVFTSRDGRPYHPTSFSRMIHAVTAKAEVPSLPFHDLRHTFITNARRLGISADSIAPFVGHKHGGITSQFYVHADPDMVWEAMKPMFDQMS